MNWIRYATFILALTGASHAYVRQANFDNAGLVHQFAWPQPTVTYHLDLSSFPLEPSVVRAAVSSAATAWSSVPTASIELTPDTASPSTIRYVSRSDGTIPQGSGVIALTRLDVSLFSEIHSAEILFNGAEIDFSFSDSPGSGEVDFQDVMTHEFGHSLGLDHAAYWGPRSTWPTMTPFYTPDFPSARRVLHQDDRCGLTAIYRNSTADRTTGSVAGRVNGEPGAAFGAHVVLFDPASPAFIASALSGQFAGPRGPGEFEIAGLPTGDYLIELQPVSPSLGATNFAGIFRGALERNFGPKRYPADPGLPISLGAGDAFTHANLSLSTGSPDIANFQVSPPENNLLNEPVVSVSFDTDAGFSNLILFHRPAGSGTGWSSTPMDARTLEGWSGLLPRTDRPIEFRVGVFDTAFRGLVEPPLSSPAFVYEPPERQADLIFAVLRSSNEAVAVDAATGRVEARYPVGSLPSDILIARQDRLIVTNPGTSGSGNQVSVVDIAAGSVNLSLEVGQGPLDAAASADGRFADVILANARSTALLDVAAGQIFRTITVPTGTTGPFGIAVHPNRPHIYLTDPAVDRVLDISSETYQFNTLIDAPRLPRSLTLSDDGSRLYVAGFKGQLGIIDTESRELIDTIDTGTQSLFRLVHLKEKGLIYPTDPVGANLIRIDLATRTPSTMTTVPHSFDPRDVIQSTSPDTLYVSGGFSDVLPVLDAESGRIVRSLNLPGDPRGLAVLTRGPASLVQADFDGDGRVGFTDLLIFADSFGSSSGSPNYDDRTDLGGDRMIDFADFILFAEAFEG